jgi:predicted dehydrogenase/nucleoside-diphosphate-sugar epimerase
MTLRAGLVGTGAISRFHVQALRRLKGVEIVGVTDLVKSRADEFGQAMRVPSFSSLGDLVAAGANVIHVLTPPGAHAAIAVEALERGCDVFVEKPLATSVEDCGRIERAERQAGRQVCVGHSLLYDPFVRHALDLVQRGAIGEVLSFDYYRCMNQQTYPASGLSTDQRRGGYGFRDIGIHALYLAEAFVGPLTQVDAWPMASGRGDVNLWVDEYRVLGHGKRGTAQLQLSWNVRPQQNLCIIQGTRGVIRLDLFGMSVTVRRQRPLPEHATRIANALSEGTGIARQAMGNVARVATKRLWQFHGLQALVGEFYSRLQGGAPSPVTIADARRVVEWTEQIAREADAVKDEWLRQSTARSAHATVLVTGGTGFIGQRLVHRLLDEGQRVRVFARRALPPSLADHPRIEVVIGDLGDRDCVRRAVSGVGVVYHLGAAMRGSGPEFERSTVTGTQHVIDASLDEGVSTFVYMSSLAVIDTDAGRGRDAITEASALETRPDERGHYTRTKLAAEHLVLAAVRDRGLRAILLRPGEVVSADKPLLTPGVAQRIGGMLVVLGSGRVRLPLVHIDDVVDAMVSAGTRDWTSGSIVQLVDDVAITQNDIIKDYRAGASKPPMVVRVPLFAVLFMATVLEWLTKRLLGRALIGPRRIRAATASRQFDCSRAASMLGWRPRVGVGAAMASRPRVAGSQAPVVTTKGL